MDFVEGDVIARPDARRDPYGQVVYADEQGGYLVHLYNPPPRTGCKQVNGAPLWNTVHHRSLDGYVAIPSMVRGVDGRLRTDAQSLTYRRSRNFRLDGRPVRHGQVEAVILGVAEEGDLWGDSSPWG